MRPLVSVRTLLVLSIALWLACGGCGRSSATASLSRENGPSNFKGIEKNDPAHNTARSSVIAYYFHRTIRCVSCITVEFVTGQTIEKAFKQQIHDGRLTWMRINLDENGGQEYEKQFGVSRSALIVAKVDDRGEVQYKELTKVWELLSDPDALSKYVENEINEYLND